MHLGKKVSPAEVDFWLDPYNLFPLVFLTDTLTLAMPTFATGGCFPLSYTDILTLSILKIVMSK